MKTELAAKESREYFAKLNPKETQGHKKKIYDISWSNEGNKFATGGADYTIKIWSYSDAYIDKTLDLKGHADSIFQIKWCPYQTNLIASSSNDKVLKIWDVQSNSVVISEKIKSGCKNIAWNTTNPNSNQILVTSKDDDTLFVYDLRYPSQPLITQTKSISFKSKINDFVFDTSQNLLITSSHSNLNLQIYDSIDFRSLAQIELQSPSSNNALAINKSCTILASAGTDALITLWDTEELISFKVLKKTDFSIKKIEFSNDSKYIAALYEEPMLDIFDIETGECVHSITKKSSITTFAWHPKGNFLVYSGDDKSKDEGNIYCLG